MAVLLIHLHAIIPGCNGPASTCYMTVMRGELLFTVTYCGTEGKNSEPITLKDDIRMLYPDRAQVINRRQVTCL